MFPSLRHGILVIFTLPLPFFAPRALNAGEKAPEPEVPTPTAHEGSWFERFALGGYGEFHWNFGEGGSPDLFDIHRLVLYVGYGFSDRVKLHSETEIEHAYVSGPSGGEVALEQAHLDFLLFDEVNVRLGRFLVPLGITNRVHEPPTFHGVERPLFDTLVIPSTWSSDGAGLYGDLAPWWRYEVYLGSSLDGSGFSAMSGIRGGRVKERPGYHEPAVMGRFDIFPLAALAPGLPGRLRLGIAGFGGGLDNGNKGSTPGLDASIALFAGDFELSVGPLEFRGAVAHGNISGARDIGGGVASRIFGWSLEGAVNGWPAALRRGGFARSKGSLFLRVERVNTQYDMPEGLARNRAAERLAWTAGIGFHVTPQVAIKADVQLVTDRTGVKPPLSIGLGAGWRF